MTRSVQPSPALTALDVADHALGNPVSIRDSPLRSRIVSDRENVICNEFGSTDVRPTKWVAPSLRCSVGVVLTVGSNEQMLGIDTRRVVTAVENGQAIGDRANPEFISESMCASGSSINLELSIPPRVCVSSEHPASVGSDDVGESVHKRCSLERAFSYRRQQRCTHSHASTVCITQSTRSCDPLTIRDVACTLSHNRLLRSRFTSSAATTARGHLASSVQGLEAS